MYMYKIFVTTSCIYMYMLHNYGYKDHIAILYMSFVYGTSIFDVNYTVMR